MGNEAISAISQFQGRTAMTTKIKFAAVLTALTVAATFALPSSEAQARHGRAFGAALLGAAVVGTAVAASQPVYVVGPRRCRFIDQFDRWGNYIGTAKVCRAYW
jgi:hypothetical protein